MTQLLLIALRNLGSHKRRTLMLGGAIAGVTALLVVLMGLSNGIQATTVETATTLMTGHVNVAGFYKVTAGLSAPVVTAFPPSSGSSSRRCPSWTTWSSAGAATPR